MHHSPSDWHDKHYRAANYDEFKNSEKYTKKIEQNKHYKAAHYDILKNTEKYVKKLEANKNYKEAKRNISLNKNTKDRIKNFKTKVNNGPYYTCVVCNRCLYRRSVVLFVQEKYEMPQENYFFVAHVESFDKREYICIYNM